jgi:hypothetical protein
LTPEFVETATALTSRVGLTDKVDFRVMQWIENTEAAPAEAEAERGRIATNPAVPPILGIHVVVGPIFREKTANAHKAMVDGRIRLIIAVLVRA